MSELAKTIERLELWVEHWRPHQPPEFIADLKTIIGAAKSVSQAIEALKNATRYDCDISIEREEILYLEGPLGAVTDSVDVDNVIKILEEA